VKYDYLLRKIPFTVWILGLIAFSIIGTAQAATVEYDLTIEHKEIHITSKPSSGMTINGGIPGPVLRFTEGDTARIHVHNKMDVETSIHWHGILVPPGMDGVPFISFPPIQPGNTFAYEFPVRQSGTYWYHSHTNLQEQSGVYGAIVIEPQKKRIKTDKDYVILFSDWTDEDPHGVIRTLKRGSEWYAIQKGSGQSILGAARLGMLGDYFQRELQRMPPMDISDVAYDRFLANGSPEISLDAHPGEKVRLRLIDGSATTYFHIEFAGGPMTIIAADGLRVEPVRTDRFLIAVAETYDVILHVPTSGTYELRATAHDGSGYTSVWVGSGKKQYAPDVPKPNLYHAMGGLHLKQMFALTPAGSMGMPDNQVKAGKFDEPGMMGMGSMHDMSGDDHIMHMDHSTAPKKEMNQIDHQSHSEGTMIHNDHKVEMTSDMEQNNENHSVGFSLLGEDISSSHNLALDGVDPRRPWAPYKRLRSIKPMKSQEEKPVRTIRLTLDGDMERYVWFLNNKPLSESDSILIKKGEIVRFVMINRTMMHHPMHLHGHFFRIINGQGDHTPLKHTVDVPPMSTTVIEFDANEFGDWFFHCHLLYHMKSGMARLIHYDGYTIDKELAAVRPFLYRDSWYFLTDAEILSNMTEGSFTISNSRNILSAEWEVGWQKVQQTEWEFIFSWERYINRFFSIFAGGDLLGEGNGKEDIRAVLGFHYLLPINIESRIWVDSDSGARFNLCKEFVLTPRLVVFGETEYDTHDMWEGAVGASYTVSKSVDFVAQWHSEFQWGGGIRVSF
jgi:CopA family copper-resistance protein